MNQRLARVLVGHSTQVKPGDKVCIRFEPLAAALALAVQQEAIRAGASQIYFDSFPEGAPEFFLDNAPYGALETLDEHQLWLIENVDVLFALRAPANSKSLASIDPTRVAKRMAANKPISDRYMDRSATGELRWVLTEIATQAKAQDAGMSLEQFGQFVERAAMLHIEDPVKFWQEFGTWQQGIVDYLNDGRRDVHIEGSHIDLRLSIADRSWINCWGKHNFPDGEVFTGPVEDSANGWLEVPWPAYFRGGVAEGIRLEFENGRVVNATAERGEAFLKATLATDDGASLLGELGIGTHPGITKPSGSILFDEKMCRTVHLALGAGYRDTGNKNESGIHWDMIVPMGEGQITIDGEIVYNNGEFTIGDPTARPVFAND